MDSLHERFQFRLSAPIGVLQAPEVIKDGIYSHTDVFALAVIAWEAITKEQPFDKMMKEREVEDHVLAGKRLPLDKVMIQWVDAV